MPVRSIIPSLKLRDYLSVEAHKSCSITNMTDDGFEAGGFLISWLNMKILHDFKQFKI